MRGILDALDRVSVPAGLLDERGVIVWVNRASERRLADTAADRVGRHFTEFVDPEQAAFARALVDDLLGGRAEARDLELEVRGRGGERSVVGASLAAIRDGERVVGVLSVAFDSRHPAQGAELHVARRGREISLTPRQREVLRHLAAGRSTDEISGRLGLSRETTRGHVRRTLSALGVQSRVAAVALARRRGLV